MLEDDLLEELLRRHIHLQKVDHEHYHDFDRLLIELGQVESFPTLFLLIARVWLINFALLVVILLRLLFSILHVTGLIVFFVELFTFTFIIVVQTQVFHDLQQLFEYDCTLDFRLRKHS